MAIRKSELLIVLPAYNEAKVITKVLQDLRGADYPNICVVDDGSHDNTAQKALNEGAIVLSHLINRGAGAAVQTGIAYAKKNNFRYLLLMDSDGQHLVEDVGKLCEKIEETKADIIIGNRFTHVDNIIPIHRVFYNQMANLFTNFFCNKNYSDTQSGFRLLNKKAIEKLRLKNRGFGFCSEMIIFSEHLNLKIEETPIQVLYSDYSLSKGQSLFVGFKTAGNILWRLIFN